jgi:long-chain acyl-CoA synthetase
MQPFAPRQRTVRFLVGLVLPPVEGDGRTEAAPVVTATRLGEVLPGSVGFLPGSVGQPLDGVDIKLGKQDELPARTPAVMKSRKGSPAQGSPDGVGRRDLAGP